MSQYYGPNLSLKVAINKQKSKVVFAEANSHFVDVLLSFLTLPLGKIVKILNGSYGEEAATVGSLTSLYRSLTNLDSSHFHVAGAKQMLLDPRSWSETAFRRLKLDVTRKGVIEYLVCEDTRCQKYEGRKINMFSDIITTCRCGRSLSRKIHSGYYNSSDRGVFMIKDLSFIISDDLRVVLVTDKFLQTLGSLGVADEEAELTDLSVGIDDIIKLLELSLTSSTPLTDLIFKKTQSCSIPIKHEPATFFSNTETGVSNSRKISLQISIQKSTNKFLFAQAKSDFIEFLVSFLAVPLAGVEHLLAGKTSITAFHNLYRSVTDFIDDKCFQSSDTINCLTNPKLAYGYRFENGLLPLVEDDPPQLYFYKRWSKRKKQFYYEDRETCYDEPGVALDPFTVCKGPERFMKEQKMYVVSDDLTTTPYGVAAVVSIVNSLRVPFSDVGELELQIGLEEALRILKASLTSTTVLTDALITPMLSKMPKQPKLEPQV